jgi:hypothetical protein
MIPEDTRAVRLFVDRAYRDRVASKLQQLGDVLVPPNEVYDHEGFLLPEYEPSSAMDHHHANAKYGRLMVDRLVDFLQTRHVL